MNLKLLTPIALVILTAGCVGHGHHPKEGHYAAYTPGLGEIMALTSMRHAKLWFAGQAKNWELAEYELEELQEGFEDAGKFHPTHKDIKQPIPDLITKTMDIPLDELDKAIKSKNPAQFTQQFDAVTAGCNACHQESAFGFNIVTRPTFNPFANQAFSSTGK